METNFSFAWDGILLSALSSNPRAKNVPLAHFLNALFESTYSPKKQSYTAKKTLPKQCLSGGRRWIRTTEA